MAIDSLSTGISDTINGLGLESTHLPFLLLILCLCSYFLYNIADQLWLSPLKAFPGPFLWRLSGIPHQVRSLRGNVHIAYLDFFKRYGPVVRISPNELIFSSAPAVRDIHNTLHPQGGRRDVLPKDERDYAGWKVGEADNIITIMSHSVHGRQRRMLGYAFGERSVREQEPMILEHIEKLLAGLRAEMKAGKAIDIKTWFNFTTFDITGAFTFGESFHCLDNADFHPWIRSMTENAKAQVVLGMLLRIPLMRRLSWLFVSKEDLAAMYRHRELAEEKLNTRLELGQTGSKVDLVGLLLRNGLSKGNGGIGNGEEAISYGELNANTSILISAGSETTATTLTACMYYLTLHNDRLARLASDIRSTFSSPDDMTSTAIVKQLPFLQAVIQETMRIFPAAVSQMRRKTPPEGAVIDGRFVPGGTIVGFPHFAAYRSPANFERPDEWIPERWLEGEGFEGDRRDVMQVFSLGPYGCIGINLAWTELRLILCHLLWHFDFELCPGQEKWDDQEAFLI